MSAALRDLFTEALQAVDADGIDETRTYLVNLCCHCATPEIFRSERPETGTPALTWLYAEARARPSVETWRRMGDVALAVGGLFAPHVERPRALVGRRYYESMGSAAYATAAGHARHDAFGQLLQSLARYFRASMDALNQVARQLGLPGVDATELLVQRLVDDPASVDGHRALGAQGLGLVWSSGQA
ncbi:MAG: hypothetical protein AAGD10_00715 [Myxococcota bacterium]